jgi:general secretion pathway protein K
MKERGAALLMALVVAAIATVIVSGLFWRQFVLVRTIENQQLLAQSRLLLRGALDWARAILREDAARSSYDALTEPWAQPLAETRLDQLGETSALASQATMSGAIEDAQSRLNLRNLVRHGTVDEAQHDVLARLASELSLPQPTADLISSYMVQALTPAASQAPAVLPPGVPPPLATPPPAQSSAQSPDTAAPLPPVFPQDLAQIPGLDPSVAPRLAPYVALLDERTALNFNTAPAELIAAEIDGLSLSDARGLVADRDRIPFVNNGDIRTRLRGRGASFSDTDVSVGSRYFFIRGEIKLQRADTRMEALVKRAAPGTLGNVDLVWEREL